MQKKQLLQKVVLCGSMIAAAYGIYLYPVNTNMSAVSLPEKSYIAEKLNVEKENDQIKAENNDDKDEKINGWVNTEDGWIYKVCNTKLKNSWLADNGNLYYIGDNGVMKTGFVPLDDNYYYFDTNGSLCRNAMISIDEKTYLTDSHGILLCGYQLYDGNRYYFGDDGVMLKNTTTPDGIYNLDETGKITSINMESLETDCPLKNAPGTSGYLLGGYPLELFMVSMAGETSGARIILGDKGRAYGLCQFDYRYDLTDFINYAYETHPSLWFEFEPFVNKYGKGDENLVENPAILHAFQTAEELSPVNYAADQAEFLYRRYFSNTYKSLEDAGFCLTQRNISVSAAMLSVNINCGSQTCLYLNKLSPSMTDEEMINAIYNLRNTVLTANGKGTNTRFRTSEPQLVKQLSTGSINANSSFIMPGGVAWDDRVMKYCGQYLTDEEIAARREELGISQYSAQTVEEATPSNAIETDLQESQIKDAQDTLQFNENKITEEASSAVIVSGFRKSSVTEYTEENTTETLPAETSPTITVHNE